MAIFPTKKYLSLTDFIVSFRYMKRPLSSSLVIVLFVFAILYGQSPKSVQPAKIDSSKIGVIPLISYPAAAPSDSVILHSGDSVFIYDGELFFRARVNGHDIFVSRKDILAKSDSLVIYQNYRLTAKSQAIQTPDSVIQKIERQRCSMITKDGSRCKRMAEPGSDRCWQHKR
jgi:hypothetical protein